MAVAWGPTEAEMLTFLESDQGMKVFSVVRSKNVVLKKIYKIVVT